MKLGNAELYVGPAGWSYDDWEGIVYPKPKPKGFRPPAFLAQYFNAIELNNTFYRPPQPGFCWRWAKDVADRLGFLYTAKLWQKFTHPGMALAGEDAGARPARPPEAAGAEHWTRKDVETFRSGIEPLVKAGRLGALLMQFPWSFRFEPQSRQYLAGVVEEFRDLPLMLEVRSRAWVSEEALRFIESLGVGFCNIDQPAFRGNIPLTSHAFGKTGYLRLHGRNAQAWFSKDAGRDQRYDYLYKEEELDELEVALREIAARVERMFVIANNHYRGQAVATGIQLIRRLTGEDVGAPEGVAELYGL